ncbi:MAG: ABC transporter ATP-binding protein [Patulibacter sp.]|nr:ABC transporter ATP-binding protein [Patulibacter sp.]
MSAVTNDAPLLEVSGLQVAIGGVEILHHADMTLHRGELLAVVGPNGAGKSTMVRAAAGLTRPTGGAVHWNGASLRKLSSRQLAKLRAFVPQRPQVPVGIAVHEAVMIGRSPHIGPFRRAGASDRAAADVALARADAADLRDRQLSTLSGGELQRVQLAVGLAQDAPVLIADEPTSALDLGATATMARRLRALADDGLAVLLVVHDLALAAAVADRVVVMADGRTVAAGPPTAVLDQQRLAEIWHVDAELHADDAGRTALRVSWLDEPPVVARRPDDGDGAAAPTNL